MQIGTIFFAQKYLFILVQFTQIPDFNVKVHHKEKS